MNQNPDGQFGGGWNDDNDMLASKLDLFLDGSRIAHEMRNRLYEGFDATGYIEDGYCRIAPMDRLHVDDLLHDRYRDLLYVTGDPAKFRRALRTAWRWDKPQETPLNWGTGKSFLYDKGIIEWYWGKTRPDSAFALADTARVTDRLCGWPHSATTSPSTSSPRPGYTPTARASTTRVSSRTCSSGKRRQHGFRRMDRGRRRGYGPVGHPRRQYVLPVPHVFLRYSSAEGHGPAFPHRTGNL